MAASMHLTPQDFSHPGYTPVKSRPNAWEGSSRLNRCGNTTVPANGGQQADLIERFDPLLHASTNDFGSCLHKPAPSLLGKQLRLLHELREKQYSPLLLPGFKPDSGINGAFIVLVQGLRKSA